MTLTPAVPEPVAGELAAPRREVAGFNDQWLQQLAWDLLQVDGEVARYRVKSVHSQRDWLIVRPAALPSEHVFRRIHHEYEFRQFLDPAWAVVPVALISTVDGPFLVLDETGGRCAHEVLGQALSIARFLRLAMGAAQALAQAHAAGVLHRDIKPGNLIEGRDGQVRLTAFSLSSHPALAPGTDTAAISGSLAYLAPEQAHGSQRADERSDLYALGVCLYEMLTGRLPFEGNDPVEWLHQHLAQAPMPIEQLRAQVPAPLRALVLKLLAKEPAGRYASAAALHADLRSCLVQWNEFQHIRGFEPGATHARGQNLSTSVLVGRELELALLHERVACCTASGEGEIILLQGPAGIGKSALVRQLHQDLVSGRTLFALGKFDASNKTLPYAALVLALRSLLRRALGEHPRVLAQWRERLTAAVGAEGALVLPLLPELALITGPLPEVRDVAPLGSRKGLDEALGNLVCAFAQPGTPLILFFDDVQGLGSDTLGILQALVQSRQAHLVLMGAARGATQDAAPAFQAFVRAAREHPGHLTEITLAPLDQAGVHQAVSALLGWEDAALWPLSRAIYEKSDGNPFFVQQIMRTLLEERLLVRGDYGWTWDRERMDTLPMADNVVELMVARIARLPRRSQYLLGLLALLGHRADCEEIARFSEWRAHSIRRFLEPAVQAGLLLEDRTGLSFSHDRVREAAYHLIPAQRRAREHTRLARALIKGLDPQQGHTQLFRIALHIQQADHTRLHAQDRCSFIDALLGAARRARETSALPFALQYLQLAQALGGEQRWALAPAQSHAVDYLYAQCLVHTGDYERAYACIDPLLARVTSLSQLSALYVLKVESLSLAGDYAGAVSSGLTGLLMFGIEFAAGEDDAHLHTAYGALQQALGERSIFSLLRHADLDNTFMAAALNLMAAMMVPVLFTQRNLSFLLLCRMTELTVRHGVSPASVRGLAWFGVVLADRFEAFEDGLRYTDLAIRLAAAKGLADTDASTLLALGRVSVWIRSLGFSLECGEKAFAAGRHEGRPSVSCYASHHIVNSLLVMGAPLAQVQDCIEEGRALAGQIDFRDCQLILDAQKWFVCTLRGELIDPQALLHLQRQAQNSVMAPARFCFWLLKGIVAFLHEDHGQAHECLGQAQALKWSMPSHIHLMELAMFSALNQAALGDAAQTLAAIAPQLRQLRRWADLNPQVFLDKLLIVEARVAQLEGDSLRALGLYESAIGQAAAGGFVQVQALAHELAAGCNQSLGLLTAARSHRYHARENYQRWGALSKVRHLEAGHRYLNNTLLDSRSSIDLLEGQQYLDLISVTKASQALSREIIFERLIDLLLANTLVHAGAQRGLMVLIRAGEPQLVATGQTGDHGIKVTLDATPLNPGLLPLSILYTVMRTGQTVALERAELDEQFSSDVFFKSHPGGSVLCLPLLKQGEVIGVLYLENALAGGVFSHGRVAMIELLAAQAAISLETSRLYAELLEENQRRRETESQLRTSQALLAIGQKIIHSGAFRWDSATDQAFWSDELFAVWGVARTEQPPSLETLVALLHPDDRQRFEAELDRARRTRLGFRHAFRVGATDGAIKHLEMLAEPAEDGVFMGVISDISERRTTEVALRNARAELARVSHTTVLGELAASIAHEINQPLVSIVSNASASVRWLQRQVPDVQEALEGLRDIAHDGKRAADIIHALQSLAKQKAANRRWVFLDDVIRQVLLLAAVEIEHKQVTVRTHLDTASHRVNVDCIQMQQVVLNLIVNGLDAMLAQPPAERVLNISSSAPCADQVVVMIEDTGPGVSEADSEKIFNAFYTTKPSGMGMGLAICRSIMNAQGGTLNVLRGRSGETLFVFTLPCA
ncbi:trifunctional serine/threonine-protein kinase/ATP-binding protein/sensor histidine kinase [Pseudomonas abieticivorans]|uniref:trifunctional serine/threonine-protein kinase/ATP-binding protein/sensor histidine kinase n=1 Tax=Pseudomonas abieticivorans TaxID=2931382 RepID=UPI0020BE47C2|nr:AAA family ATPase [Pseudomonas sp. PIA16]